MTTREIVNRLRKRIDQFESQPLPATEGAKYPFFSPDGDWVGFSVEGGSQFLKRLSLRGESPHAICKARAGFASWGEDGAIVFGGFPAAGLFKVHSDGGDPEQITSIAQNFEKDETWLWFPQYPVRFLSRFSPRSLPLDVSDLVFILRHVQRGG